MRFLLRRAGLEHEMNLYGHYLIKVDLTTSMRFPANEVTVEKRGNVQSVESAEITSLTVTHRQIYRAYRLLNEPTRARFFAGADDEAGRQDGIGTH